MKSLHAQVFDVFIIFQWLELWLLKNILTEK